MNNIVMVENPETPEQVIIPFSNLQEIKNSIMDEIDKFMQSHHFSSDQISDAKVVAGELITNVKHAYDDDVNVQIEVDINITDDYFTIVVTDYGHGEINLPVFSPDSILHESGRGFHIVMELAQLSIISSIEGYHKVQATIQKQAQR